MPIIHCLIPARSGSKGIKDKNIMNLDGKPMIAYSIELAKQLPNLISKVVVSTDSLKYAEIAREYGAETPYLRSENISGDYATDWDVMNHYLNWVSEAQWPIPDAILHLRPTFPQRSLKDLEDFINCFLKNWSEYDSARSVILSPEIPYKMYRIQSETNSLEPLYRDVDGIEEPYNIGRQILPQTYLHNGCFDIVKTTVIRAGSMSGRRILPFLMSSENNGDIDTVEDLKKLKLKS